MTFNIIWQYEFTANRALKTCNQSKKKSLTTIIACTKHYMSMNGKKSINYIIRLELQKGNKNRNITKKKY